MAKLIMLRGIPASGKSTWAKDEVARNLGSVTRLNRDTFRQMMHNDVFTQNVTEDQIVAAERGAARELLMKGIDVIIDDTNLTARHERMWASEAQQALASFEVKDFDIDLPDAIRRDSLRPAPVGEAVVRKCHQKLTSSRKQRAKNAASQPQPVPVEPYVPDESKPDAIMVDIDGTIALHTSGRDPYDLSRCDEDSLNEAVAKVVRQFRKDGYEIIFLSGRSEAGREKTTKWLAEHLPEVDYAGLFMRSDDDHRVDHVCKLELFNTHVRNAYNVHFCLDDRDQVVRRWREINIPTFQVNFGNF